MAELTHAPSEANDGRALQRLLDELGRLPGIGAKSAQRLAYYLLEADAEEGVVDAEVAVLVGAQDHAGAELLVEVAGGDGEPLAAVLDEVVGKSRHVLVLQVPANHQPFE